jgi:hypothetical protein
LTRDGVDCFFDQESIGWGDNFVLALEKGIAECGDIVIVLSANFCQSEWAKLERTSAMADDPAGLQKKLRPLLLKQCEIPLFLKPIQMIDVSTPEKFEAQYPRICRELGGTPPAEPGHLPSIPQFRARHSLGERFIGQEKELQDLHDYLNQGKTAVVQGVGVVMGTGGLGKTQLAIEYAYRFADNYPGGIFWVDADRGISGVIQQVTAATDLKIDGKLPEEEQLYQLWAKLNKFPPTLVILDNFPEKIPLRSWLPNSGTIHILVTTRRRDLTGYSQISLNFLCNEEGVRLLNTGPRRFGAEAEGLVKALGGLPLALELAKNFLNLRPELSIEMLLEEMKKSGEIEAVRIFAVQYFDELPSGHIKEVAATIELSWRLASPEAKRVLQIISLLAPVPVPRRLLRKIAAFPVGSSLSDPLDRALSELAVSLSLMELDNEHAPWAHRLVSGFVRTMLEPDDELYQDVVAGVNEEMARVTDQQDIKCYKELEKVIPH